MGASCLLVMLVICGCSAGHPDGTTTNASGPKVHLGGLETYRYWADGEPTSDTEVLNGQYWSSPHFTKEYIMYLEMKTTWAKDFASDNKLQRASKEVVIPKDAPAWFAPPHNYEVWSGSQGSLYFIDAGTGHMFIYEVQL